VSSSRPEILKEQRDADNRRLLPQLRRREAGVQHVSRLDVTAQVDEAGQMCSRNSLRKLSGRGLMMTGLTLFGCSARNTVLEVFPDANVIENRLDDYPVTVTIRDESGNVIFTCDQRSLFSKYASKRAATIELIKAALNKHYS